MGFANSGEVFKYIGGVFEEAFRDTDIGPKLQQAGVVLRFNFTDPDTVLVVDLGGQRVGDGSDMPTPVAAMNMTADTGNGFWQGKVNLPMAMAKSKIKVEGNIAGLLKLAPLTKKLYPVYVEALRRDGREDLLV